MEHDPNWNTVTARRVGERVAYFRKRVGGKGITAQALADRCAELGHPLDRTVIAKLEKGLRQSVTVADLVVLANALGVSPTALVVPIDQDETVRILPRHDVPALEAMTWFTGERRHVWASEVSGASEDFTLVDIYRAHERRVADWEQQMAAAARLTASGGEGVPPETSMDLARMLIDGATRELRRIREEMRRAGARLPALPVGLQYIDDEE